MYRLISQYIKVTSDCGGSMLRYGPFLSALHISQSVMSAFSTNCSAFSSVFGGQVHLSKKKKVKRQPTLIISFSQQSLFFERQSKIKAEIRPAPCVAWGVCRGVCYKRVHTKMHCFCISMTNTDQSLITCTFKVESSTQLRHNGHRNHKS